MRSSLFIVIGLFGFVSTSYAIDSEPILKSPYVAIDSEPILKSSLVAIDSEPILKVTEIAIDSEPILVDDPKAIDSEPLLKEALGGMSLIYKKSGRYVKVTYKVEKAEDMGEKEGKQREEKGQVQRLRNSK